MKYGLYFSAVVLMTVAFYHLDGFLWPYALLAVGGALVGFGEGFRCGRSRP